jgi:hypothetical protein
MIDTKRGKPYHLAAIALIELFKKSNNQDLLKEAQDFLETGDHFLLKNLKSDFNFAK